jgi:CheY-like chemotaxis protein
MDLAPQLPSVSADADQIQQVFINLLNNALHAMLDESGPHKLKISTRQKNELIQIVIEDNGPGVPPEFISKIFEPFFTTKEVGTGTGLGLSIAHSIMAEHKGRIFYQPATLGGAGFVLEFPIAISPEVSAIPQDPAPLTIPEPTRTAAQILVLDDERGLAELLGELLKILGYTPTLCYTPVHALELIPKHNFDLIISDFRMPGLNGQQFYEIVKGTYPILASRVIFVTGDVVNEETQDFLRSIGNPHLGKPFNLNSVKEAVAWVLSAQPK